MTKIAYRDSLHLSKDNVERLNVINTIIEEYNAQGYRMTLRQLYYQLVSRGIIPNKTTEYAKLSDLLGKGRMAGIVDWNVIEDRIREPYIPYYVADVPDAIDDTIKQYRLDRQEGQDNYIEVWCFPQGTPVMTSDGCKPIEAVRKNMRVLTSDGTFHTVTGSTARNYFGEIIRIKSIGIPDIQCTPNHRILVARQLSKPSYKGSRRKLNEPEYVRADELKAFDYLCIPRIPETQNIKSVVLQGGKQSINFEAPVDFELCQVIGLYLSEGSITNGKTGGQAVRFTFNKTETNLGEIIKTFGIKHGFNPYSYNGKGTLVMHICSKALVNWLSSNFGNGAYQKHLPVWVMHLPEDKQMQILKYYFIGDGTIDKSKKALVISSKSESLVYQIQLILSRNGYLASVKPSHDSTGIIHRIVIAGKNGMAVSSLWNLPPFENGKTKFNNGRIVEKYAYLPIKELIKENYSGNVFNIEVKDKHNYCIPCVVHNCEKDALSGVLKRVTKEYHVRLMVNRGYSSITAMHDASLRFSAAAKRRQQPIILYLGDHDPSGVDMIRDIRDRLVEFGIDIEVESIALTDEQIAKYNPPPNPAKITDPRAKAYIQKYGPTSWEVDALRPDVLHNLVVGKIENNIDMNIFEAMKEQERLDVEKLEAIRDNMEED